MKKGKKSLLIIIASFIVQLGIIRSGAAQDTKGILPYSLPEYTNKYTKNQLAPELKPAKTFYVSVTGNDKNSGTMKKPFKSLEAARDAIRGLKTSKGLPKGGVHVVILEGIYDMNQGLSLTEQDGGTKEATIVYRGVESGKVIFSGGVQLDTRKFEVVKDKVISEYLKGTAHGKVMSMDLSSENLDSYFPGEGKYGQISMNGHMLQIAQWPNRGYHHIDEILERGPTTRWLKPGEKPTPYSKENPTGGKFTFREEFTPAIQKEFERTGDMRAQGYFHNDWYFQDEPVGKIDLKVIQLLHHTRYGIEAKIKSLPRRVRLLNVLAELDEPGEWYYDKIDKRLYVWPIDGFVPGESSLTVIGSKSISANKSYEPVRKRGGENNQQTIISLDKTSYVTIRDITIENTRSLAVKISGGEYNLLAACTLRNGAGKGVVIEGGKYNGITACDFYDLYTAFSISGGNFVKLIPCYNFATNNVIRSCRIRGYGVVALSGVSLYFAHNLLHSMNGAVMYETVNLLMEYNEFYNIGYEMGDFNVAYCGAQWYTMNNIVRYNFVHHLIEPGGHPVAAFRNDDNGAGLKLYGNVFYRPGRGAAQFDGPLNDFQNNITMDCYTSWWTLKKPIDSAGIQARWDDLAKFGRDLRKGDKGDYLYITETVIGKEGWLKSPWKETFPELKAMIETNPWAQTFGNVHTNYMYEVRNDFHIHGGSGTVEGMESKEVGRFIDLPREGEYRHSVPITLDAFVDVSSLDFRFKEDFVPMEGFTIIPFENIGLVKDQFRTSPPNRKEYRVAVYERFKDDKGGRYNAEKVNSRYPMPAYMKK